MSKPKEFQDLWALEAVDRLLAESERVIKIARLHLTGWLT